MRRREQLFQNPCTLANVQLETIAEENAPRDTVKALLIRKPFLWPPHCPY